MLQRMQCASDKIAAESRDVAFVGFIGRQEACLCNCFRAGCAIGQGAPEANEGWAAESDGHHLVQICMLKGGLSCTAAKLQDSHRVSGQVSFA